MASWAFWAASSAERFILFFCMFIWAWMRLRATIAFSFSWRRVSSPFLGAKRIPIIAPALKPARKPIAIPDAIFMLVPFISCISLRVTAQEPLALYDNSPFRQLPPTLVVRDVPVAGVDDTFDVVESGLVSAH